MSQPPSPLTKEELLAKFDEAYQLGLKHGRAESADLIDWAQTLLGNACDFSNSQRDWNLKVNEWREAKDAPSLLPPKSP